MRKQPSRQGTSLACCMHACTCVTSDQMHECGLLDPGPVGIHVTMLQGAWNPPCAAQGAAPPPLISSLNLLPNCRIQPRPRSVPRETQRAPCLCGFKKRGRFIVGEAVTHSGHGTVFSVSRHRSYRLMCRAVVSLLGFRG